LDLEKYHELSVFHTFFSLLTGIHLIFGTLLCHTKIQIKCDFGFNPLIFPKVMALGLRNIMNYPFSGLFFSLPTDIHLIFGTLLCHIKIQLKFEFGFDQLIFPEVMALGF
jgi:hypothetical protein